MPDIYWNPLIRQEREADTLFLLDADEQVRLLPAKGGFIQHYRPDAAKPPWGDAVQAVPGKFRPGIASLRVPFYGTVRMPSDGLLPAGEWTIEFWLKRTPDYPGFPNMVPVEWIFGDRGYLRFTTSYSNVGLEYNHYQLPDGQPFAVRIEAQTAEAIWANQTWVSIASTLKNGVLHLLINGVVAATAQNVVSARLHGNHADLDGFHLVGSFGHSMPGLHVSDLRVSARARTSGQSVSIPDAVPLLLGATPTGKTINQELLGALHSLEGSVSEALVRDSLRVIRTDKLINVTPIAAGVPDAAHPSAGASGLFSYDWQVVDRTFDYYVRLNLTPYISLDSTPQILGGLTPPYSGARLASDRSYTADFNNQVPNDFAAFAAIVYDLVYHCIVEKNYVVPYWGFWNEPNEGFWNGTRAQFFELYTLCARAVKSVSPDLKIGGPEVNFVPNGLDWIENFLEYCGINQVPVDFVATHFYSGDLSDFAFLPAHVASYARNHGISQSLEIINGETHWQGANLPYYGYPPFRSERYFFNDWHAAWTAVALMEQQTFGIKYSIYTMAVSNYYPSGLVDINHSWANNNVFRLWAKLLPNVLPTDFSGSGDMHGLASQAESGDDLSVLISRLRYAPDGEKACRVVPPQAMASLYRYARIKHYQIDNAHANYTDAGADHAELEAPEILWAGSDGSVTLSIKARAVHFLGYEINGLVPRDVTTNLKISLGGLRYDRPTRTYFQSVTLVNQSPVPLAAPPDGPPLLTLTLAGLGANVALVNRTGLTGSGLPGVPFQTPYFDFLLPASGLNPGARTDAVLQFSGTGTAGMTFTPTLWAGPGKRT